MPKYTDTEILDALSAEWADIVTDETAPCKVRDMMTAARPAMSALLAPTRTLTRTGLPLGPCAQLALTIYFTGLSHGYAALTYPRDAIAQACAAQEPDDA